MLSTYSRRNKKQIRISRAAKKFHGATIFCALLGVAVGSASLHGQEAGFRLLPKINQEVSVERAAKLFTINEKRSLPPMVSTYDARIIKSTHTPVAQVNAPIQSVPVILGTENVALERDDSVKSEPGRYVVSFSKPLRALPVEEEVELANDGELPELTDPLALVEEEMVKGDLEASSAATADDKMTEDEKKTELDEILDDLQSEDESDDLDDDLDDLDDDLDDDDLPKRQELGAWPKRGIQEVRVDPSEYGSKVPEDRSGNLFANSRRFGVELPATEKTFAWAAPNIRYQPLYLEDVSLERYGQTSGLIKQPFSSAVKFFGGGAVLPLRAMRDNPYSCDSPLGFCRPGSNDNSQCGCQSGSCESCGR